MLISRFVVGMWSLVLMVFGNGMVSGQDYPNKPVRIVAGAAGGGGDFTARIVAQGISGPLGQQVIVENRGAPVVGAEYTAKAPPDGYTLFVSGNSIWILPMLQKTPYEVADLAPVSNLVREVNVLVVNPALPAKSVSELITLAKSKPGALNYGTGSIGTIQHIGTELFKSMAGIDVVHVSYKGSSAQVITALLSGEIQMSIIDPSLAMPHVKAGKLRALAVTSAEPSALVPGLPTIAALLPGYEATGATVMFAPAKTPAAIIRRLNQEIVRAMNQPDVKEKFFNSGVEVVASTPEQFAATIKSESASFAKVIKDAGIKL